MILSCNKINKSYVTGDVLVDVSFHVEANDKAAIVGVNGAGKSTLLKIIMGLISADSGQVTLAKDCKIGYLAQHQELDSNQTIYNEVYHVRQDLLDLEQKLRQMEEDMNQLSGEQLTRLLADYETLSSQFDLDGGYTYKSQVSGVLKGLGFTEVDYQQPINALSGGQKTRVALAKLLLSKPEIILLDEPTNHLDIASVAWLENFLLNYKGCVIVVSHDRYFINKIVNKVIELEDATATSFTGNYSDYTMKKEIIQESLAKAYENQQAEIKHQEAVINKLKQFNREKSIKRAESRQKMLDKIDVLKKPISQRRSMKFHLEPQITSGNDVLTVEELSKSFDNKELFHNLSFEIKRGERLALIGDNGTGKTTILKIINELIPADSGKISLGANVSVGYYDQEHHVLHMEKTIFDEISDDYPNLTNTQIRTMLSAFLFTEEDVFKQIKDLSGGERGRVSLAKLMLSNANFLILDEPTNHLDMVSKEALEYALNHYTGTVLYVSHDRYFINQTATRIIELKGKTLINYIGNYDYYLEKVEELSKLYLKEETKELPKSDLTDSASKADWKSQKEEQARIRKIQNQIKSIEEKISVLEEENAGLEEEMCKPEIATNIGKLSELNKKKTANDQVLEELYEKWEELSQEA